MIAREESETDVTCNAPRRVARRGFLRDYGEQQAIAHPASDCDAHARRAVRSVREKDSCIDDG